MIRDSFLTAVLVAANLVIFMAYVGISGTIAWIVSRAPKVPFPLVWWLFAGFILSCGGAHFCFALVFFRTAYHLEAAVCVFTALISSVTAILVFCWRRLILTALRDAVRLDSQLQAVIDDHLPGEQ